eukprot:4032744-Pyramimonas_sp.AAC.1
MSHAKWAKPAQVRASLNPELQGCLRRNGPDQIRSRHLGASSCKDVSGERAGPTLARHLGAQ